MEQLSLANPHRAGMATDERHLGDMTPTEAPSIPLAQGHKGSNSNDVPYQTFAPPHRSSSVRRSAPGRQQGGPTQALTKGRQGQAGRS